MDFGLIALILVAASKVLDYIAPLTKSKLDDKARDAVHFVLPMLPAAKAAAAASVVPKMAAPEQPKSLTGFRVTDHR